MTSIIHTFTVIMLRKMLWRLERSKYIRLPSFRADLILQSSLISLKLKKLV